MWRRSVSVSMLAILASLAVVTAVPAQNVGGSTSWNITVAWQLAERHGQPRIEGGVVNGSLYTVIEVRVLVESLDAAGNVQANRIVFVPGALHSGMTGHFDVAMPAAASYRVTLINYDRVESPALP